MHLLKNLLADESGFVLSAEAVLVGTVGVLGATVGLSAISQSLNDELGELALSIRSLDQSFEYQGQASCGAWTAGSSYIQPPVEESRAALIEQMERDEERIERARERWERERTEEAEEAERELQNRERRQERERRRDRDNDRDEDRRDRDRERNRSRDRDV